MNGKTLTTFLEELEKLGAISDEEAEGSLRQLDKLEANKLTPGQIGRYAGIGAVAAPAVNVMKNAIKGGENGLIAGTGFRGKLRHMVADAAGGALLTGAVPIVRHQADQHAEVKRLHEYLSERGIDPEKTANMDSTVANAFITELEKIALPRYEQEIAAGNISRQAVAPGAARVNSGYGPLATRATRAELRAPAPVDAEVLDQRRLLNEKLYHAQAAQPYAATGVHADVSKDMLRGHVAATYGGVFGPQVHAPAESANFLRGMGGNFSDRASTTLGAFMPEHAQKFMPQASGADPTLNKAVLQHELGEASEMGKPTWRPFASHLGPEPIVRENLALQGDPEAIQHMAALRGKHSDDALVQRGIRQVGGTPDSPIPLGGRQHRALEGFIDRNANKLNSDVKGQRLMNATMAGKTIGYAPPEVTSAAKNFSNSMTEIVKTPGLMGRLRKAKDAIGPLRTMNKFIKGR